MSITSLINAGWSHQYVTQTNQPWAGQLSESPFGDVGPYANAFGMAPQYVSSLTQTSHTHIVLMDASSHVAQSIIHKDFPNLLRLHMWNK